MLTMPLVSWFPLENFLVFLGFTTRAVPDCGADGSS